MQELKGAHPFSKAIEFLRYNARGQSRDNYEY